MPELRAHPRVLGVRLIIYFRSILLNEKPRLLPLISQGNFGGLHEIRFRKTA
jgi:hypothetical protein